MKRYSSAFDTEYFCRIARRLSTCGPLQTLQFPFGQSYAINDCGLGKYSAGMNVEAGRHQLERVLIDTRCFYKVPIIDSRGKGHGSLLFVPVMNRNCQTAADAKFSCFLEKIGFPVAIRLGAVF